MFYYTAVLTHRIAGLARPSVRRCETAMVAAYSKPPVRDNAYCRTVVVSRNSKHYGERKFKHLTLSGCRIGRRFPSPSAHCGGSDVSSSKRLGGIISNSKHTCRPLLLDRLSFSDVFVDHYFCVNEQWRIQTSAVSQNL